MSPRSWASRHPRSALMSPVARCPRPAGASAASPSGGPRRSADGTANDRAMPRARSTPDNRDQHGTRAAITALRCRIWPYLIKAARCARRGPACALPLPRKARPAHAGPSHSPPLFSHAHSATRVAAVCSRLHRRAVALLGPPGLGRTASVSARSASPDIHSGPGPCGQDGGAWRCLLLHLASIRAAGPVHAPVARTRTAGTSAWGPAGRFPRPGCSPPSSCAAAPATQRALSPGGCPFP
jgi:hypothetical protein